MRYITTCLLSLSFILLWSALSAQHTQFAFVYAQKRSMFDPEPVTNYKFEVARKVYDQLIEARGDYRMMVPDFVMNDGEEFIAWMNPEKVEIGLEEAAYDVCASFGVDSLNALAALLAHEIVHYYEKHDWTRHFINNNEGLEANASLESLKDGIQYETQADYLGGMLALSAGFNTYHISEEFLTRAYKAYGLPETLKGYPDLGERQQMSANTAERLKELNTVFQTAGLLTLIGVHEVANYYYKFLLKDFQSSEVYNNAGVNATLAAIALCNNKDLPFVFPLELDKQSRLAELATRAPDDAEARRKALLRDADRFFESAERLNGEDPSVLVNRSIVAFLDQNPEDAKRLAEKALSIAERKKMHSAQGDAWIALGIFAAQSENSRIAKKYFKKALDFNPELASINLEILDQPKTPFISPAAEVTKPELIENLYLDDFRANPEGILMVDMDNEVYCAHKEMDQSEIFYHYAMEGEEFVLIHQTKKSYPEKTNEGIKIGDIKAAVIEKYGEAGKYLGLNEGFVLVFKEKNILFIFDEYEKLTTWVVFQMKLSDK